MEGPEVRNSAGDARDNSVVTQSGQIHHLTQNIYHQGSPRGEGLLGRLGGSLGIGRGLALNQAVAWLHESGMAASEYLDRLASDRGAVLALLAPEDPEYQVAVMAAWNMPVDRLAVSDPGPCGCCNCARSLRPVPSPPSCSALR
ncbi:hypothetical protein GCM10009603_18910 [Nocardiopsis exhalans]